MGKTWRVVGINFDHMHMGDNLRMAFDHPNAEIVGICDEQPERMASAKRGFAIDNSAVFTDYRACIEKTKPDFVLLCPATAHHADWTERVAEYKLPVLMEKPFAATIAEADRMIAAMEKADQPLAINWPLRWYPSHVTTMGLIDDGVIGDVIEVHYYDGNRGPLWHGADKDPSSPDFVADQKSKSWFYKKDAGGGSLLDYLGYGVTLGTWFHGGKAPIEVTAVVDDPPGLEVDEHSITVARYDCGLSKFETRWGTFTDPWSHQPQPKCGFVIKGEKGTISSYDYDTSVRVQTHDQPEGRDLPVDELHMPFQNPVQYFIHCLEIGAEIEGPLSPAMCRIGQQIVDSSMLSAREKRTVPLVG